jgi:hypothetical protein
MLMGYQKKILLGAAVFLILCSLGAVYLIFVESSIKQSPAGALAGQGFIEGKVVDSAGQALEGAEVFLHREAVKPRRTSTDFTGRFRLEGLRAGPTFVFAEKDGYRLKGAATTSGTRGLKITLLRNNESAPPWTPARAPTSFAEEQAAARKLLEMLDAVGKKKSSAWTCRLMARIDPYRALKWSQKSGGPFDWYVRGLAAEKIAETDIEEAVSLLPESEDFINFMTLQSLAKRYASSDAVKAERLAEEAILLARRMDQPNRTLALAEAGRLVARLGKSQAGQKLIEEAAASAAKMAANGRSAYTRGPVAVALAPYDFNRAMSLFEPLEAGPDKEITLENIAIAIAVENLEKSLELVERLESESNIRDNARLAIAYQLAPTRPEDALRVVDSMNTFSAAKTKAEAYGWLAEVIARRDRQLAWSLIDTSFVLYENSAQEMGGWSDYGGRGAFAARVLVQAHNIGYPEMGRLIDRALAMRPMDDDGSLSPESQRATVIMAKMLALVDPETARHLVETVAPGIDQLTEFGDPGVDASDWHQAWALADLPQVVGFWERRLDCARTNADIHLEEEGLDAVLDLLTSKPAERPHVMLLYIGGYWFPNEL